MVAVERMMATVAILAVFWMATVYDRRDITESQTIVYLAPNRR